MKTSLMVVASLVIAQLPLHAQEEEPLFLVTRTSSKVLGEKDKQEIPFGLMAEIEGSVNFSLRGDFKQAKILSAVASAPDGKEYPLEAMKDGPPAFQGGLLVFLRISYGDRRPDFSIGDWSVKVSFEVDGNPYEYTGNYHITLRKSSDGIWGEQLWANQSKANLEEGVE